MHNYTLLPLIGSVVVFCFPYWETVFLIALFTIYTTKALDVFIGKFLEKLLSILPMKYILFALDLKCRLIVIWNILLCKFDPVVINDVQVVPYMSKGKIYHAILRRNLSSKHRWFLDNHSVSVTTVDGTQRKDVVVESHIELPHLTDSKSVEYFIDGNPISGSVKDFRPIIEKLASQDQGGFDD